MAAQDVHISGDVSTFGIDLAGGTSYTSYLALARSATLNIKGELEDTRPGVRMYASKQIHGVAGTLNFVAMNQLSAPEKVTNLDLTVFTIGTQDFFPTYLTGEISVALAQSGKIGTQLFDYGVCVGKEISANFSFGVPDTAANGSKIAQTYALSATASDHNKAVSITLNSIAVTFAATIESMSHKLIEAASIQQIDLSMAGHGGDSGTFPAAPTGTTTLLEKILNTTNKWGVSIVSKSSEGSTYTGKVLPTSYRLSISNAGAITESLDCRCVGTWTIA